MMCNISSRQLQRFQSYFIIDNGLMSIMYIWWRNYISWAIYLTKSGLKMDIFPLKVDIYIVTICFYTTWIFVLVFFLKVKGKREKHRKLAWLLLEILYSDLYFCYIKWSAHPHRRSMVDKVLTLYIYRRRHFCPHVGHFFKLD